MKLGTKTLGRGEVGGKKAKTETRGTQGKGSTRKEGAWGGKEGAWGGKEACSGLPLCSGREGGRDPTQGPGR